jgi:hypothetical protein
MASQGPTIATDRRQDDHGGRQGWGWQAQLRGICADGVKHGKLLLAIGDCEFYAYTIPGYRKTDDSGRSLLMPGLRTCLLCYVLLFSV